MIIATKEFTFPMGENKKAQALAKEYKELFDPSPSCRISANASGNVHRVFVEDDYESLADYEVKWPERTATPEFKAWIKKWFEVAIDGSFEVNFRHIIE